MQDYAYICETVLLYYAKVFAGSVALVGRGNDKEVHEPYIPHRTPETRIQRPIQNDISVNQAPSGFSWVAGVLNRNCVVAYSSYSGRLRNWIVHKRWTFQEVGEKGAGPVHQKETSGETS